jgi:hypothetical protein
MSLAEAAVQSAIEAIEEPRTARMDQLTKPSVKASIEVAADLMGIEASAFVVMSAYARAQELLSSRQQTLLRRGRSPGPAFRPRRSFHAHPSAGGGLAAASEPGSGGDLSGSLERHEGQSRSAGAGVHGSGGSERW